MVPRIGTQTTASRLLRSSGLPHRLPHEGAHPPLSCALHPPILSQPDYPKVQPLVRSTSSRRRQVAAASTPWCLAHDQTNGKVPSPSRSSLELLPCPLPPQDSTPGGRTVPP